MTEFHHVSVLLDECIEGLAIKPEGIYVDGTLGGAGHSSQIAPRLTTGCLIGIDRDEVALEAAGKRLAPYADRVKLVHSNFCRIASILQELNIPQLSLIKGDARSASIAAASIIAKVARDRLMDEYDKQYPQYGFASHKGYGTAEHVAAIRKYGPCPIHRLTFEPVRSIEAGS